MDRTHNVRLFATEVSNALTLAFHMLRDVLMSQVESDSEKRKLEQGGVEVVASSTSSARM